MDLSKQKMFNMFGVGTYAKKLEEAEKFDQLKKLEELISQYILVKAFEDLTEDSKKSLDEEKIESSEDLFMFFSKNITNFNNRLIEYGRDFATQR